MLHLQVRCLKSCWSHHLQVNIANQEHAKYVENHVPGYLWKAFVTQDTHDRDLLQQNLQGMGVPIINARDTNNLRAPSVTPQMQEVGIVASLDEVLSAPEVVKHVLIGQAALDHSVRNHETCSVVLFF
jgi:hypothetical protein